MKTFLKPLTISEERTFLEHLKQGEQEAKHVLIERNMRLVAHIVKKYSQTDYEMEDLISIGTIGLIKAVDTFNPDRSNRLGTYAAKCIDNAILSQIRLQFQINPPRAEKNQNGVFGNRLPGTSTSFAPLRMAM
ncbi:MAG: sigma-70 family RNA polymerase sigma factor [Lachnospiraceae bacterium]|nr:sigma-70 family RNA polymerase sigma factor [Lachnospiraceae bacterium]